MIDDKAELGLLIKLHRERSGRTQEQLASDLETNRTAVAHLEKGLRMPAPLVSRACENLGIPDALWRPFALGDGEKTIGLVCHCATYYTPWRRASKSEQRRDKLVFAVKNDEAWTSKSGEAASPYEECARIMRQHFPQLFQNQVLVPVPKCTASRETSDPAWASLVLAKAIAAAGSVMRIERAVVRAQAIRKSSDPKARRKRPGVLEHVDTLSAARSAARLPPRIVLVDDVVTKGTTMIACAQVLRAAGWNGAITGLAVAYDRGPQESEAGEGRRLTFSWDGSSDYPSRTAIEATEGQLGTRGARSP